MHGFELNYNVMAWYAENWTGVISPEQSMKDQGRKYTNHFAISVSAITICFALLFSFFLLFNSFLKFPYLFPLDYLNLLNFSSTVSLPYHLFFLFIDLLWSLRSFDVHLIAKTKHQSYRGKKEEINI